MHTNTQYTHPNDEAIFLFSSLFFSTFPFAIARTLAVLWILMAAIIKSLKPFSLLIQINWISRRHLDNLSFENSSNDRMSVKVKRETCAPCGRARSLASIHCSIYGSRKFRCDILCCCYFCGLFVVRCYFGPSSSEWEHNEIQWVAQADTWVCMRKLRRQKVPCQTSTSSFYREARGASANNNVDDVAAATIGDDDDIKKGRSGNGNR